MNYEEALYKHFYDIINTITGLKIIDNHNDIAKNADYVFFQVMTMNADSINTESSIGRMSGSFELFVQIGNTVQQSSKVYEKLRKVSGDITQNLLLTLLDKRTQKQITITSGTKEMILNIGTCKGYEKISDVLNNKDFTAFSFFFDFNLIYN